MSQTLSQKISLPKFSLKLEKGPHAGEIYYPEKAAINIGRGIENEIVLGNDPKISRQHARITFSKNEFTIENISGKNTLYVDGKPIQMMVLKKASVIIIGDSEISIDFEEIPKPTTPNLQIVSAGLKETPKNLAKSSQTPFTNTPPATKSQPLAQQSRALGNPFPPPKNLGTAQKNNIRQTYSPPKSSEGANPIFYIFIILTAAGLYFFLSGEAKKEARNQVKLKSKEVINKELEQSRKLVEDYMKQQKLTKEGEVDTVTQSAQSYFVRGFRDFRQGQYARAIQSLQACLSFDPNHVLAKKYLNSAIRKLDEKVQILILQGKRYRGSNNYRLCKSSFQQVMIIRKDPNDALYKEAKTYYDECDYLMRGRF